AAACTAAIDVLEKEPEHVQRLWSHTRKFKQAMSAAGFDIGHSETPITPIIVGESSKAKQLSQRLFELGVFALPIVFPMVARDKARIRTIMNAALTEEDVQVAIGAFEKAGRELGIV
ncbi:MAG TPA: aminotransferase class I/II-fold pyridoxal phosphate-dependent enzyme, partial [Thermoplasmata archaeon]|nr:aminotransferase class I/II-fold pyridoxal phosphate-dependent enzyme [Thermoplasmata archaeon]